mmetsp:Transcript_4399/g.12625  ORF Transcript_4399/g.12625 Transcript_4399/m.12625 type:complete len:102 (-) Transcript_4399:1928-2233(-)
MMIAVESLEGRDLSFRPLRPDAHSWLYPSTNDLNLEMKSDSCFGRCVDSNIARKTTATKNDAHQASSRSFSHVHKIRIYITTITVLREESTTQAVSKKINK